jgi:hypothetical protein
MWWNFFGSGHGKREHDGVGAIAKKKLLEIECKSFSKCLRCREGFEKNFCKRIC